MTELEAMILDLAMEDRIGAWEFIWRNNSVPDLRRDRETVIRAVASLVQSGQLEAYLVSGEKAEALDTARTLQEMGIESHWEAPAGPSTELRFEATAAGEERYLSSRRD